MFFFIVVGQLLTSAIKFSIKLKQFARLVVFTEQIYIKKYNKTNVKCYIFKQTM